MFGCDTHLLKHIKQAILGWSFRQILFLGCYPVFPAISAPIEFIVFVIVKNYFETDGLSAALENLLSKT